MIYERICDTLSEILEQDPITIYNLPLDEELISLGFDSLKTIHFLVSIEESFNIEFLDEDLLVENFSTIQKIIDTLSKYTKTLKKVLISDCDNVLWKGIAGEEPLSITTEILELHKTLYKLHDNGTLLCLCSKNEPDNISAAFASLNAISQSLFVVQKINRNNKADNILAIAKELGLSLDSFVFIDDSPYEIGLINHILPDVETFLVDFSCSSLANNILSSFPSKYHTLPVSRTELYRDQKKREKDKHKFSTIEEYNSSLCTKINIEKATLLEIERIAELSQRTNQCNLSNTRYTESQLLKFLSDSNVLTVSLKMSDRYGDMGLVAAAVVSLDSSAANILSFFVSCRAFDRDVEKALLSHIKTMVGDRHLHGVYCETNKNRRYRNFYKENGVDVHYDCQ